MGCHIERDGILKYIVGHLSYRLISEDSVEIFNILADFENSGLLMYSALYLLHLAEHRQVFEHVQIQLWLHDDVIKWKHFPRNWPFVRGIHRSPGEFPAQTPVTQSFDVFFDLRLNKRLSKQSWG